MNRADRRRLEKDDERALAPGLDIGARSGPQAAALMRLLYREVMNAKARGDLRPFFNFFLGNFGKTDRQAPREMIACGKGCSHCCNMWVSATAPEVLLIASAVGQRDADTGKILERCGTTRDMSFEQRGTFVQPCPLLSDAKDCSVYSLRPLACRTAASLDAELCARAYLDLSGEDISTPLFFLLQRTGYAIAMRGAFLRAGLPLTSYEFNHALAVALETSDAEARWLSGEDIFHSVQRDPGNDPMQRPDNRQLYDFAFAGMEA